jgi:antitoxin (DNA-binding transcriptional repressor) of toxin-antitoxin stability system
MMTVTTSKVRAGTIDRVARSGERVLVERRGEAVAALVPMDDLRLLESLEDKADVEAAVKALKEPGRVSWEHYKRQRASRTKRSK